MTQTPDNSSRLRQLLIALPYLVAALGFPAVELVRVSEATRVELIQSFNDDAFFYFETARNLAEGHGSTFDRISPTNGYHPLWMALLVPVYALGPDSYQALVLVTWLASTLWFLAIAGIYRIATALRAAVWFSPGLLLLSYQKELWFKGMETGLLLTILIGVIWKAVKEGVFEADRPRLLGLACWLAWMPMARLDAVFLVGAGALVFFFESAGAPRKRARRTLLLVAPSALLVGLYMAASWLLFGQPTPVSGQAKSLGAPFANFDVIVDYLLSKPLSAPGFELLNKAGLLTLLIVPAWLFLLFGRQWIRPAWRSGRVLASVLGILLVAQCGQLLYYSVASSWPLWSWYHYYTPLLLLFSLPVLVRTAIRPVRHRRVAVLILSAAVALGLAIRQQRTLEYHRVLQLAPAASYRTASVSVADRLNETTPSSSVFAMGDRAGSLAYQLDRPVLQTEGLVNSVAFLTALENGSVHAFLQEHGTDYIVYSGGKRSGGLPEPLTSPAGCARLTEPKFGRGPKFSTVVCDADLELAMPLEAQDAAGGGYWVWRYRPDLNPP